MNTAEASKEKLAKPRRQLKVIFSHDISMPSEYLKESLRFKNCKLSTFEEVQKFVCENFNVNFEIIYFAGEHIYTQDLEQHDYIAFLSVKDPYLTDIIIECAKLGIPIIFVRHDPAMNCDIINTENKETECFQRRSSCEGYQKDHCNPNFFDIGTLEFKHSGAPIPKIQEKFDIKKIPLFSMSFLIDFLIWYGTYGATLKKNRDEKFINYYSNNPAIVKAVVEELLKRLPSQ